MGFLAIEMRKIVKIKLELIDIDLLGLRVCKYQRRIDVYLFTFVEAYLDGALVGYVDLDREEQEGGFYKSFLARLHKRTENEGISDKQFVSSGFLFDLFCLSF